MRQRVVDRALGEVQNVLELHGKRRGASGLDNRLARRHNEVRQVEHRGAQSLVTFSVPRPFCRASGTETVTPTYCRSSGR